MAHPAREPFVKSLQKRLPGAEVVWDECNDRWDTGRRALLAFDPNAEWHLVVQDDAVLCRSFLPGVRQALAAVPAGIPVSFYTGKTRPYAAHIRKAVAAALEEEKTFFSMRGPLWGVAVALPVKHIQQMVEEADLRNIPNYDTRMAEWFHERRINCWYSVPSLVDHRVGPENPSLVPGRVSTPARTAHQFIGEGDPRKVNWTSDAWFAGDPTEWWFEDYTCARCSAPHATLAEAITHACQAHGLSAVDFVASTRHHMRMLTEVMNQLEPECKGELILVGGPDLQATVPYRRVKRSQARWKIGAGSFVVCGAMRDLKYLSRPAWSLDGKAN